MRHVILLTTALMILGGWLQNAAAQANSWTNDTSGNWEDLKWSLGIPPGSNQNILLTNGGWKALGIGANTAQNFPQTLTVNSISVASPVQSFNTLLLNYSGLQNPLTVNSLSVASNSAVAMFSSALQLNGPAGSGLSVGGTFDQNDSMVAGNQIDVGYIGPGVYHFNGGLLAVSHLFLSDAYNGVCQQQAGSNGCGIVHLDGGTYLLQGGDFGATIYFNGGNFIQRGGHLSSEAAVFRGSYELAGGVHSGPTKIPWTDGYTLGFGSMLQSGGTNASATEVGTFGYGTYTLSNGVLATPDLRVGARGSFEQWGGSTTVTGVVSTAQEFVNRNVIGYGTVTLNGGTISTPAMQINGAYRQGGGTNTVAGDVTLATSQYGYLTISGGTLKDDNVSIGACWVGGYEQSGGVHLIANQLSVAGNSIDLPGWQGATLSGGQLSVSNIVLTSSSKFTLTGGTLLHSGTLSMANANLHLGSGSWQLGPLQLKAGADTNSTIYLPTNSATLRFADSQSENWENPAALVIENWNGSLNGGGAHRIIFGNSSNALTVQQVSRVQFQNPAHLPAGVYRAHLLGTGEMVPAFETLQRRFNGHQLIFSWGPGYTLQTTTNLAIPFSDVPNAISPFTNQCNDPQRFFALRPL